MGAPRQSNQPLQQGAYGTHALDEPAADDLGAGAGLGIAMRFNERHQVLAQCLARQGTIGGEGAQLTGQVPVQARPVGELGVHADTGEPPELGDPAADHEE